MKRGLRSPASKDPADPTPLPVRPPVRGGGVMSMQDTCPHAGCGTFPWTLLQSGQNREENFSVVKNWGIQ